MATNITRISGLPRTEFGKGAARRLRRDWRIPAVLYGTFHDPIHVSFELLEFQGIVRNNGVNAVLEVSGMKTKKAAVTEALHEYLRKRRQAGLIELFGTMDFDPDYDYKPGRSR